MKTKHLISFLGVILLMMPGLVLGQQKDKMVHLKVIKNDQTIVDTSFLHKDLEEKGLQQKISELAGIDITMHEGEGHHTEYSKSMSHSYVIVTDGEEEGIKKVIVKKGTAKEGEHHMAFIVTEDDTSDIIVKGDKIGVLSKDSLKNGNVYIIKEGTAGLKWISEDSVKKVKKGDVWIIGEDDDHLMWISEGGMDDSVKVIVKKAGDDDGVIHIHEAGKIMVKEDDGHMVIHTKEGEEPGEHKIIKVKKTKDGEKSYMILVDADNEGDKDISGHKNVYVYTDEETNGTKFDSRSVMVKTKKIEGSDDIEIIVTIEEKEKGEMEKKSPESKQKKDNDRKKM